jgi:hypothetical protein
VLGANCGGKEIGVERKALTLTFSGVFLRLCFMVGILCIGRVRVLACFGIRDI